MKSSIAELLILSEMFNTTHVYAGKGRPNTQKSIMPSKQYKKRKKALRASKKSKTKTRK